MDCGSYLLVIDWQVKMSVIIHWFCFIHRAHISFFLVIECSFLGNHCVLIFFVIEQHCSYVIVYQFWWLSTNFGHGSPNLVMSSDLVTGDWFGHWALILVIWYWFGHCAPIFFACYMYKVFIQQWYNFSWKLIHNVYKENVTKYIKNN